MEVKEIEVIKIDGIEIIISDYINKTIYQDLKTLIYYEYDNHKIKRRDFIEVVKPSIPKGEYILKVGSQKIGPYEIDGNIAKIKWTLEEINDDFFQLIPQKDKIDYVCKTDKGINIWNTNNSLNKQLLFDYEKYQHEEIEKKEKGKYNYNETNKPIILNAYLNNGLFEIYYKMLHKALEFGDNRNKSMAMCSYLAFKEYFNNKNVSYPNVFIKGIPTEHDCLFLNKNISNDKENSGFILNKDDARAVVELKTSGFFSNKDQLKDNAFINYITENDNELEGKTYLYFSYYESFSSKKTSIHYYEFLISELLYLEKIRNSKRKHYGLFAATKKDSYHFLIPYEYDLKTFMDEHKDIFG